MDSKETFENLISEINTGGEKEFILHTATAKEIRFLGSPPSEIAQNFLDHVRAKNWADVRCDAVFTNRAVYIVPATRERRDLRTLGFLLGAGTIVGLLLGNQMQKAAESKAVRGTDMHEAIRSGSRYEIPYWLITDSKLQVFEQCESWDPFGGRWSTNLNIAGPCHYKGKSYDAAVEIRLDGRITEEDMFVNPPPDYFPVAMLFGYSETNIKSRKRIK